MPRTEELRTRNSTSDNRGIPLFPEAYRQRDIPADGQRIRREDVRADERMTRGVIKLLGHIFGRTGWALIVILFVVISATFFYLPSMLNIVGMTMPERWPLAILTVIRITVATWVGTLVTSIARVIVWLRYSFAITSGDQWNREKEDVQAIQRLSMWLLGLFTVLAAYLTQWFGGGE